MSPGRLQLKRVLLANRIELEIIMFETETDFIVSSVTVERGPDGAVDVSVATSPRQAHYQDFSK
jgi:hypothetical protein